MILDRREQAAIGGCSAAIVQEKDALPHTPQRSGAEFIRAGRTLRDVIREPRAHVMEQQI